MATLNMLFFLANMHILDTNTHTHTRTNRVFGRMKKNRSNDESEGKRKRRPIRVNIVSPRNLQKVPTEKKERDVKEQGSNI